MKKIQISRVQKKSQNQPRPNGIGESQTPRSLAVELTKAEEQERKRIAQLLHDQLQPLLIGAQFQLACLKRLNRELLVEDALNRLDAILKESVDLSRSLTTELSPRSLSKGGLLAAILCLGEQYQARHGSRVKVAGDVERAICAEETRIAIFQGTRELLLNVVKHANATVAQVRLSAKKDRLSCVVADNGKGFDIATTHQKNDQVGGFGLPHLHDRIASLGGSVQVKSASGQGTQITISCPTKIG